METLKDFFSWALSPLIITMALQFLAWGLWLAKRRRLAQALLVGSLAFLLVGSLPVFSYGWNRAREYVHAPLEPPGDLAPDQAVLLVVLGTGFNPDLWLPPNSRISGTAHARFLEAVRLYRSRPDARLLVSVADSGVAAAEKQKYLDAMIELIGLDADRVGLISEAESTKDEAELVAEVRKEEEQVVVVTSAIHMPRAMKIFQGAGLEPFAAPCDFHYPRKESPNDKWWKKWVPSDGDAAGTRDMLYEWAAGVEAMLRK